MTTKICLDFTVFPSENIFEKARKRKQFLVLIYHLISPKVFDIIYM